MAKELNDTQRLILSAAAARDDLRALPLPETLRAPPHIVKKAVATMIRQGLLGEVTALPDDAVWTESNPGGRVTLVATSAGLAAVGIDPWGCTGRSFARSAALTEQAAQWWHHGHQVST